MLMKNGLAVLVVLTLGALTFRAGVEAQDKKTFVEGAKMFKALIHVNFSDAERQKHGLKNVANMLKEVGNKFEIEVVCHGAGIGLLVKEQSRHAAEVERLHKQGVRFAACENTMREKSIAKESLLPGVVTVPSGAVEVVRKQQEGYGYFKP
jgi:intracellular sulfur oxidation DsrE/DsrF family protein